MYYHENESCFQEFAAACDATMLMHTTLLLVRCLLNTKHTVYLVATLQELKTSQCL